MDCEVQIPKQAIQKGGFRDEKRSVGVGSRQTKRTGKTTGTGTDPFDLLSGVDNVS